MKSYKIIVLVSLLLVGLNANAKKCHFKDPVIKKDVCKVLKKERPVQDNPYFYDNPNAKGCDINMTMPGLPDFDLGLGEFKMPSVCDGIKSVTGDDIGKKLAKYLEYLQ